MKINIVDINKIIELNNLEEVTNPVLFSTGFYPNDDSFLSYKIFGLSGTYDRKTLFAYIDLKKNFLHPVIYKALTQMDRKFAKLIDGSGYYRINSEGQLEEDEENGETGIEFLYKNWKKLSFKQTESHRREIKISLFKNMKMTEIFVNKWLVIPAFYRDLNAMKIDSGKPSVDLINKAYVSLLSLVQSADSEIDFMGHMTENKVQLKLVEIYEILTSALAKKEGFIKHDLMGKTVDYSTRGVISSSFINSERYENQMIKYGYVGVPLSHLCNLFFPFFLYEIKSFIEDEFSSAIDYVDTDGSIKHEMVDPSEDFSQDKIKKMINLFITSQDNRLNKIKVKHKGRYIEWVANVSGKFRPMTILDLLYITATKIVKDKHVYVTRYPVDTFHSIYPARITIITTTATKKVTFKNEFFEEYPVVDDLLEHTDDNKFIDSIMLHPSCLEMLGADYDGDTVSLRSVWTQEANQEAERLIFDKKYFLDANGKNIRVIRNEAIQTLYTLTKN